MEEMHDEFSDQVGILTMDCIYGNMTEPLTRMIAEREWEVEIIVSTHIGMRTHDMRCVLTVYEKALEREMGKILELA